ncbi:MAG: inorganic phosphate transporter [Candidatus Bipolaricaulia bacterium]
MIEIFDPIAIVILIVGFYMAWNIGANDLANAMGTSVGSGALRIWQVVLIAGSLEFVGAVFFGSRVTKTVAKAIVPLDTLEADVVAVGGLATLLAAGLFITLATLRGVPVSTTHSIVGATLGFGLVSVGVQQIAWKVLLKIVASWVVSPLVGGLLAFLTFKLIVITMLHRVRYRRLTRIFATLQILSAGYVAFAHGSNDVANAIGPMAVALGGTGSQIPLWLLALGGGGIVIGVTSWGYRVIETVGKQITTLVPISGFSAEFGAATGVLIASSLSLPVSTTHTLVGSVIGVGLARGFAALNLRRIQDIFIAWIITVPTAAVLTMGIYVALRALGL